MKLTSAIVFTPKPAPEASAPPVEEQARIASLTELSATTKDLTIGVAQPATIAELKAMSVPTFNAWFDANFDTAAKLVGLVRLLTLVVVRRLL